MENLELQTQVINLGKLFVKELGLEPGVDTFSRWMAHYIAEKITVSENSSDEKKEIAEQECFEAILKLWTHRWSLPSRRRPLEDFAPLLNLLQKINPDRDEPYFYPEIPTHVSNEHETGDKEKKSEIDWLSVAEKIDRVARIWLEFALKQSAVTAKNELTEDWLKNAVALHDNEDTQIVRVLLDNEPSFNLEDYKKEDFQKKHQIEKINRRVEQLENFSVLNDVLLSAYKVDLAQLKL